MKKRTIKAFWIGIVIGVISLIVGAVGTGAVFYNWDSHADFSMSFPANVSSKTSSYYSINGNLELQVTQSKGKSTHKYSIYSQARNTSSWSTVISGITFKKNDVWDGEAYEIKTGAWKDTRFKVNKTKGVNTASKLELSIGEVGE